MHPGVQPDDEDARAASDGIGEHCGPLGVDGRAGGCRDLESGPGDRIDYVGFDGAGSRPATGPRCDTDPHLGTRREASVEHGQSEFEGFAARGLDGESLADHRSGAG